MFNKKPSVFPQIKKASRYVFMFQILLSLAFVTSKLNAQSASGKAGLYEQTSEMGSLVIQYGQDINAIRDFYSPYTAIDGYPNQSVQTSPEERKRLSETGHDYLEKLKNADFENFSIYGKVDYILLKKEINFDLGALKLDEDDYNKISTYIYNSSLNHS